MVLHTVKTLIMGSLTRVCTDCLCIVLRPKVRFFRRYFQNAPIILTGQPIQHRRNMSIFGERGADPVVTSRTLPPKLCCSLLNTSLSHIELLRIIPLKINNIISGPHQKE